MSGAGRATAACCFTQPEATRTIREARTNVMAGRFARLGGNCNTCVHRLLAPGAALVIVGIVCWFSRPAEAAGVPRARLDTGDSGTMGRAPALRERDDSLRTIRGRSR